MATQVGSWKKLLIIAVMPPRAQRRLADGHQRLVTARLNALSIARRVAMIGRCRRLIAFARQRNRFSAGQVEASISPL
ncbi:hypothetical protein [Pseudomonas sp. PA15(2017)]|uniref:hypothetical protein n=1 Tax=Pseudomonas sp. PA15(2017) TaxID=1932111 RepID=UPI00117A5F18|nr:hypothetical protein [Pseudomonas sp. PA15(2017)]